MRIADRSVAYVAVLVGALVAFVFSSLYYSPFLLGGVWRRVDPAAATAVCSPWKPIVELVRTLAISYVMRDCWS